MTVKMNRENSNGSRSDRRLDYIDIEAVSFVDVDKDGLRAPMHHRFDRWKCSMRWDEHFIAAPNSHGVMEQKNSRRPRGTENRLFGAGVIRQFGFERFALFRQNVRPRFKRAHRRFSDVLIEKNARKRDFFH